MTNPLSPIPSDHPRQRFLVFVQQACHFEAICDRWKALTPERSKNLIANARVLVLLTAFALSLGGGAMRRWTAPRCAG